MKGPYLAMITIAFGFIVEHGIVECRGAHRRAERHHGHRRAGAGRLAQRRTRDGAAGRAGAWPWRWLGYTLLSRGTWGAAMRAVRDSETAAESIGLNPLVIKTVAFAVSAAVRRRWPVRLFAPLSGFVTPHTFGFLQSILFVLVVMIGGAGSVAGPLIGALIVGLLPELLSGLEEYRLLFFGGLLLLVLWVAPDGVVGAAGGGCCSAAVSRSAGRRASGRAPTLPLPQRAAPGAGRARA